MKTIQKFRSPFLCAVALLSVACTKKETVDTISDTERQSKQGLAGSYYQKGEQFLAAGITDSAFSNFYAAKATYEETSDSVLVAYNLLKISDLYHKYNDYGEMESAATDALRLLKPDDTIYAPIARNNLGIAYRAQENYAAAANFYKQSLALTNDTIARAIIATNMAYSAMEQGKYKEALPILNRLSRSVKVKSDSIVYARILDNLGFTKFRLGQSGGLQMLETAEQLRAAKKDAPGLITSYLHLAKYHEKQNLPLANAFAKQANALAKASKSIEERLEALRFLSRNVPEAREFAESYISLTDSITKVRRGKRNQFAAIKYDFKKANAENQQLKTEKIQRALELEKRKRQRDISYLSVGFIILIGFLLYLLLRKRHRSEKIKESYKTETRIAKKVHDELANDVYNVLAFAETQDLSDTSKKETLLHNLDSVYLRTRDISRENNPIETGTRFTAQLRDMLSEYNNATRRVLVRGIDAVNWETLSENQKVMTYRILQELMVNMRKHSNASLVALTFEELDGVAIRYSDNGVGMLSEKVVYKSGLQNVENRIAAIDGTVTFEAEPGSGLKITIRYPSKK